MAALSMLLVSCKTLVYGPIEESLNTAWVGSTHADVVRSYGVPDREASDGADGLVLVYEKEYRKTYASAGPEGVFGPDYDVTSYSDKEYTHFYLDSNGIVYQVRSNLQEPVGKKIHWGNTIFCGAAGAAAVGCLISYIAHDVQMNRDIDDVRFNY